MKIENTKKILIEIQKGIIIGLLLISFYCIGVYIDKNKNKNKVETKIKNNLESNKEINGYEYRRRDVMFLKRDLGYEKMFSKTVSQEELDNRLKDIYCNAVKEIKKVDRKIVPGTNIPFEEATYTQVDDAYKEYLQEIAQIRQIYFMQQLNDNTTFEQRIGCQYKDTKWNMDNNRYSPSIFYSLEIEDYYRELE